ncbi:conserved exported hypothetical protein [Hyphomicrobiales bacterium]|nr:conserved exported hypothetical protein [Hyphomicrobiales bacterium]CAH1692994.1 conserved exported hypothetical protein [Hyphomicrobiales bacterium]
MKAVLYVCGVLFAGSMLAGCQTSEARSAQLAKICADPGNRQPGSFYFAECQAVDPSSDKALQKDYMLGSPTGD